MMSSRKFVFMIVMLQFGAGIAKAAGGTDVRLKGRLGDCLDQMIERQVSRTDVDYITTPFLAKSERKGGWQTEFWGKWMQAAAPFQDYSRSERLREMLERGLDRILASQEDCGYIGNYPDDLRCGDGWDVWGIKYTMMGLLHYYDWKVGRCAAGEKDEGRAKRALDACRRLCDYVMREIGPDGVRKRELWQTGNWSGYASSSILEPVVWLHRRTRDRRYLDFADYIVKGMSEPASGPRLVDLALRGISVADRNGHGNVSETDGSYVCKRNREKAYEMMSCYQGLLDYVEEKSRTGGYDGLERLKLAAVRTAEDIVREEVNLAGGCSSSEAWFHGRRKQHLPYPRLQETCVTMTWMRLCEKLLDVTDDPRWAEEIERTFYNAYLGALRADGTEFAAYTPLAGDRWHGMDHCYMHVNCCNANGPRGYLCFLRSFAVRKEGCCTFNFYGSAFADGFEMYSLYPRTDTVRIVSRLSGEQTVRLRIPSWSARTEVRLNGEIVSGSCAGTYLRMKRDWKQGDIVEIRFDMHVVAHRQEHRLAFTRGPILLARDSRFNDGNISEVLRQGLEDGQQCLDFEPVRSPSDEIWMSFSAILPLGAHYVNPEGRNPGAVHFCDYASAGNSWSQGDYYRTWLEEEYNRYE